MKSEHTQVNKSRRLGGAVALYHRQLQRADPKTSDQDTGGLRTWNRHISLFENQIFGQIYAFCSLYGDNRLHALQTKTYSGRNVCQGGRLVKRSSKTVSLKIILASGF